MTSFARSVWVALPFALFACGGQIDPGSDAGVDGSPPHSDAQPPPPPSDAQPPPPPPLDGGECNNLSVLGSPVSFNQVPANAPSFPSGGSPILQGEYVLVGFTSYTGPNGASTPLGQGQVTLLISGGQTSFDIQVAAIIGTQSQHSGSTGAVVGPNQLTLTGYCPQPGSPTGASYYFDGSTLWLRASSGSNLVVDEQYSLVTK